MLEKIGFIILERRASRGALILLQEEATSRMKNIRVTFELPLPSSRSSAGFRSLRFARGCASCAVRSVPKLPDSTMSQATLLLVLSFTLLQPLESFLAATPRASADRLDMRSRAGRRWDCLAGNTRLEHTERLKGPLGRTTEGRWRHHHFFPLDLGLPSPAFRSRLAASGEGSGPVRDKQRKRKRGPKEHVPLVQQVGEDDGKEPWDFYASPTPTSSLPSPNYEERLKFGRIMEDVLAAEKEEELPGLLTKHVEFLLSVDVTRLTNDLISLEPTLDRVQTLRNAYDFIITFLEGVVESTADLQKQNRELLREIIEVAKVGPVQFERAMEKLQDRFTYEFIKYLDAEVNRLDKVERGKDSRGGDGREVLNVIKIVRTRVCAQMDLMMGEDIAILTRMLSYEDRYMMKATLRAVFREKSPEAVQTFGRLVSKTLEDINERGTEVDSLLKYKLADMAEDTAALARAAQERREQKPATEDSGA